MDQFLKLGGGGGVLLRHVIKILLLQIRSSSCSINIIQSKEKQREDGCLLISDR